ncbi:MAG TPA: Lrp/AsnC ligand binding domain-containing protein, partial [Sphingopyxis terrae]|nr:Lrp/AsnC ligand binding domain-containing protein [Sphingopyxis terrae]
GGLAEARECYMLNGEIDFLLKVVARDLQSFQSFLTAHLTSAPNVTSVKTSLTIRTAKQLAGIPVEP